MAIQNQYNFSGGMNVKVSPLFLADNECELIQNYHLDNIGSLTKRLGTSQLLSGAGSQIVDNQDILNMFFFKDTQGTDRSNILVAVNDGAGNSDIFAVENSAWAVSKSNDTASVIPYFTTFIDYIFRTNGSQVMGSSADPRPTGGSWGTTNCMATYIFKYICVWEDRVYVLNDNSSTKYNSRIAWSSLPSGAPLAITWAYDGTTASGKDAADINPDDGDEITWGEPFGSRLLIFKNRALYRWTFGQVEPDKIIDVGTLQGLTVKQIHGICFFANEYGVWAYTGGGQPQLISRKVQPFFDAMDWTAAATAANLRAEVDNDHYYLYVGTVNNVGGDPDADYTNCVLVYTISLKSWHIYTLPWPIKAMARFQLHATTSTYNAIYVGNNDGYVYRFLAPEVYTDRILYNTTQPINGRIITKEYPINFPKTANLKNLYVVAQKAQGTKANYKIDRGQDFKPWKDLKERITEGSLVGRARTFQLGFTNNSDDTEPEKIEGFSLEREPEPEERRK